MHLMLNLTHTQSLSPSWSRKSWGEPACFTGKSKKNGIPGRFWSKFTRDLCQPLYPCFYMLAEHRSLPYRAPARRCFKFLHFVMHSLLRV